MKRIAPLLAVLLLAAACGPLPAFPFGLGDRHIEGQLPAGIAVQDETELDGTWGVVFEFATILTLPVLGDRNAGSQQLWLHNRTFNPQQGEYEETSRWCSIDVWEVEGNRLTIPDSTLQKHPAMSFTATLDKERGYLHAPHMLDLWGLRNLPDPNTTDVPTRHNWNSPPQSDWIYDEDEDGHPATTGHTTGVAGGEVYQVVRGIYEFEGSVVEPGRIRGLATAKRYEQNVLQSTNSLAEGESRVRQDPDENLTWFEMVQLTHGAGCGEVIAAQQDGRLAQRRPF